MGVHVSKAAASEEEKRRHREVEKTLMEERRKTEKIFKLLLLGSGDSGKTTIIKQMKILHANGFNQEEIKQQCSLVAGNIVQSIAAIIRAMGDLGVKFGIAQREADAKRALELYKNWTDKHSQLNFSDWACLERLWSDAGVQACFARSNEYQLSDSTKYFCDSIERISAPGYVPSEQDMLRTRAATVGIVEFSFTVRGLTLKVIDVGGQRSQRKKWIHCFENINAIIFVASLSEYNQVLFEDNSMNRMHESLKLFSTVVNSPWFVKSSILLFLNKRDLFQEKLKTYPLSNVFPDYKGGPNYDHAAAYVQKAFESHRMDSSKSIYTHKTCATDTKNVEFVLKSSFDIILKTGLSKSGLI